MRLFSSVLLALVTVGAHAQDKAKGEMSFAADYRLRDTYLQNEAGASSMSPAHANRLDQRLRLHLNLKPSERLSVNATALSNFDLGQSRTEIAAEPRDRVSINQAYGSWMISDDFWFKFGRLNYQIGDGFTVGINDWEATPYAFDGALFHYEVEFARIQLFAFRMRNFLPPVASGGMTTSNAPDNQHNAYGISFELKTLPEILKAANVHVIRDAGDRGDEAPTTQVATVKGTQGIETVRYGAQVGLAYGLFDLKLWYAGVSGKDKYPNVTTLTYHGAYNIETSMVQGEIGVNLVDWHASRLFVQYHVDSGDRDSTDKINGTYDSYFHIKHASAGHMDLFDWGNLTALQAGVLMKPRDSVTLGLSYWLLSRTETGYNSARPTAGLYGGNLAPAAGSGDLNLNGSRLGDEVDLWAEHQYANGLIATARAGYFRPGEVFDPAAGPHRTDGIVQLMLEGRINF